MRATLLEVFGERDDARRRAAVERVYAPDVVFSDPDEVVTGHDALDAKAKRLLDDAPGFVFRAEGPALVNHEPGPPVLGVRSAGRRPRGARRRRRPRGRRPHHPALHHAAHRLTHHRRTHVPTITTPDGVDIFYKDWGQGQPIVFSHGWPLSSDDWDAQPAVLPAAGLPGRGARPARPRPVEPDRRRPRHGPLRRRPGRAHRAPRPARRRARRALDRWRRGGALPGAARRVAGGEGRARRGRAAADGADRGQPRRSAEVGLRRHPGGGREAPLRVLPRAAVRTVLRVQPSRPGAVRGGHRQLVAAGDDGRRQGPLRRRGRVLADRLHRGPARHHGAGAGDARRRRPGRAVRRLRPALGRACCRTAR
nr:hypothetical protein [Angustibacter aerolatus]